MQTAITEKIVYSPKPILNIEQVLTQAPCERCNLIFTNCDPTQCQKLTDWLDKTK